MYKNFEVARTYSQSAWSVSRRREFESRYVQIFTRFLNDTKKFLNIKSPGFLWIPGTLLSAIHPEVKKKIKYNRLIPTKHIQTILFYHIKNAIIISHPYKIITAFNQSTLQHQPHSPTVYY